MPYPPRTLTPKLTPNQRTDTMPRFLAVLALALSLAACGASLVSPPDPVARAGVATVAELLAPFEDIETMPPVVAALPYRAGHAYAILVFLPAPGVVDLSDPNRARDGLARFLDPVAVLRAGTVLGHAMIGWRCADGAMGLVSKSGARGLAGLRMLASGWGAATLLSEYTDGRLVPVADIPAMQRRVLAAGGGRVAALEIGAAECQRMRQSLAGYITHPDAPAQRYTMVPDPTRMDGDGCGSFALWLAGRGGVFRGIEAAFHRDVLLRDSFLGLGQPVAGPVLPFDPALTDCQRQPIALSALMAADWTQGAELGAVRLMDMELLLRAVELAYARAGWPLPPRLDPAEPGMAALDRAAGGWLARYGSATPVRIGAARAVVLHRR